MKPRQSQTRHFPILDLGGGGYKFSIYFVQDCRRAKFSTWSLSWNSPPPRTTFSFYRGDGLLSQFTYLVFKCLYFFILEFPTTQLQKHDIKRRWALNISGLQRTTLAIEHNTLCACVIHQTKPLSLMAEHWLKCVVKDSFGSLLCSDVQNLPLTVLVLNYWTVVMETSDLDNVSNSVTIQSAQSCDHEFIKFSNFCAFGEKRLQDRNGVFLAVHVANNMQLLTRIHGQIPGPVQY